MGTTLTPITFFSDDIMIDVHTASRVEQLGFQTIRRLAGIRPCSLYETDRGDYVVNLADGSFAQGKPTPPIGQKYTTVGDIVVIGNSRSICQGR